MDPEIVIVIVAVFVSGGAIGSAGTLLAQWLLRKVDDDAGSHAAMAAAEREVLRDQVTELHLHMHGLDARLDFTERLLDGALPVAPPPDRRHLRQAAEARDRPDRATDGG